MSMKIGIMSDVHADAALTEAAFTVFQQQQVDRVLCAGDIAGYGDQLEQTVALLHQHPCDVIQGNHDVWYGPDKDAYQQAVADYLHELPLYTEYLLQGKKVYMVHANPPDAYMGGIKLLDENAELIDEEVDYWSEQLASFDYDVLIVGHTHQVFAEYLGGTLVINPGSTKFNYCCAILTLPEMQVEFFPLNGKRISRVWNWGAYRMTLE